MKPEHRTSEGGAPASTSAEASRGGSSALQRLGRLASSPLLLCLLLALSTVAVYWPVAGHDFIPLDDGDYVFENATVKVGLTWQGVVWALTANRCANWHPVTWWSYML